MKNNFNILKCINLLKKEKILVFKNKEKNNKLRFYQKGVTK